MVRKSIMSSWLYHLRCILQVMSKMRKCCPCVHSQQQTTRLARNSIQLTSVPEFRLSPLSPLQNNTAIRSKSNSSIILQAEKNLIQKDLLFESDAINNMNYTREPNTNGTERTEFLLSRASTSSTEPSGFRNWLQVIAICCKMYVKPSHSKYIKLEYKL